MEKKSVHTKKLSKPKEKPKQKNVVEKTEDQIAYLAGLIEQVSDALISTDSQFNVLSWNAAAEAIYGWKAKEVIGHPIGEFLKTNYLGKTDEKTAFKQILEHGHWTGEVIQSRKDHSDFPVLSSVSTIKDNNGQMIGLVAINHDITKRRLAEEKLRASEERYRSLFNNMEEGVAINEIVFDEHGDMIDYIILEVNSAFEKHSPYKAEEVIGRRATDVYKMTSEFLREWWKEHLQVKQTIQEEYYHEPSGRWFFVSSAPTEKDRFATIFTNITERKRAEETIQQYATELERRVEERTTDLTRADRAKDEFLANMSHELRTPLNSILGFSEALLDGVRGPLTERQSEAIETILSSGHHLLGLINDILDVSKIEAGKLEFHPQIVDATEICQHSLFFVKEMAEKKSVILEFEPLHPSSTFLGDPQRMKQILANLLSNSIKFTPENGKITLDVRTDAGQNQIHFRVADTGIGIASEDLERLFDPFIQVDGSLTRGHDGSGLGLALAYKLVGMHGGNISVESEVGKGSSFTVALPWNQKTDAKQEKNHASTDSLNDNQQGKNTVTAAGSELSPGERGTILLAEDKETNVMVIKDYLEYRGYQVIIAHNGVEALSKAEELSPDAILMDIQMPEMDGLEAIRRLRANPRFASTPVIAVTAFAMPGDRERCIEAGANEYLSKPISLKALKQMIERFL